ncbi:hypothetical protein MYAM1_003449 [Malassezia yamatoensis]|uniref:Transmembrane protein n=1 Tax=Malassezia yamatoensis TaxID=253288 RepID=A0AAJ5YVS4_9BASI|nr:hypothetical protein MYAM1_003449 [Malassezia yamatoensis]
MSPSNKLFPLMVVVIVLACFGAMTMLVLFARRILRRSNAQVEPEAIAPSNDIPEKRAKLRHATSWESDATLCDDDVKEEKIARPPLRPMMSSVSRGTHGRFGSFSSTRSNTMLSECAPELPDKSEVTRETRERVLQNRASVCSTDSGNTLYSLYDQVEKDQADALRENDLAKPCVTHAKKGWSIRPSNLESIEDVSVDLPAPRTLVS